MGYARRAVGVLAAFGLVAAFGVAGCAGAQPREDGPGGGARATDRACAVSLSPSSSPSPGGGRVEVRVACGLALTPADSRDVHLTHLARAGAPPDDVRDSDIRATAEYRSLMDPRNVWQWGDRVTEAEALATCRLILADLQVGLQVRWQQEARSYLARARGAGLARGHGAATMPGSHSPSLPNSTSGPPVRGTMPGVAGTAGGNGGVSGTVLKPRVAVGEVLDRGRFVLPALRRGGDDRTARILERVLSIAAVHTASLGVVLSGAKIVIATWTAGGGTVEVVVVTGGAAPVDMELAAALSQPLLQALAGELGQVETIVAEAGGASAGQLPAASERMRYRDLVYRPTEQLDQAALEEIERLEQALTRQGMALEPAQAGTAAHKARAWAAYRTRRGAWPYARWSGTYEQNMVRPSKAHRQADRVHAQLGWGKREARVVFEGYDGTMQLRVLDIGDKRNRRGVEVKSGKVYYRPKIAAQIVKDATLISEYGWTITWLVDGRLSEPVRQALRAGRIAFTETRPHLR